jgi:hypothetical protein
MTLHLLVPALGRVAQLEEGLLCVNVTLLHENPFGLTDQVTRSERVLPGFGARLMSEPVEGAFEGHRGAGGKHVAGARRCGIKPSTRREQDVIAPLSLVGGGRKAITDGTRAGLVRR